MRFLPLSINAAGLLVAFIGVSFPFSMQSPGRVLSGVQSFVASAGATLTVGVAENPYNTLAQQLSVKQLSLEEREAALKAREEKQGFFARSDLFSIASFILSVVLLILVGLNFYMDWRRGRKKVISGKFQVDLS